MCVIEVGIGQGKEKEDIVVAGAQGKGMRGRTEDEREEKESGVDIGERRGGKRAGNVRRKDCRGRKTREDGRRNGEENEYKTVRSRQLEEREEEKE